jgi:hypothetical protein
MITPPIVWPRDQAEDEAAFDMMREYVCSLTRL